MGITSSGFRLPKTPATSAPLTFWAGSAATESCERIAATVSPGAVIDPPFARSTFAAMLTPSSSRSVACTTYLKLSCVPVKPRPT